MQVRIVTLRYSDGLQGFPEDAMKAATAGREVLEVREHFYMHANVPHLTLLLIFGGDAPGAGRNGGSTMKEDPGKDLPESLRPLYRDLRIWRNDRARVEGVPSYTLFRNVQLAEICRLLPRTLAQLREIQGVGEATCSKYGKDVLALIPAEPEPSKEVEVGT
jgi:superfamily II DNA helicase RecQ